MSDSNFLFFPRSASSRARSVAIVTKRKTMLFVAKSSILRPAIFVNPRQVGHGTGFTLEKPCVKKMFIQ